MAGRFAHDALFWRRLAELGARRGPGWWARFSPPVFGVAAAALLPEARRCVRENLRQARGERGAAREAWDVARTFATYAGCLSESLASGSKNDRPARATFHGGERLLEVLSEKRGAVLVTAHTAGWEVVGPLLVRHHSHRVLVVMGAERDVGARQLHDDIRNATGLQIVHVGSDPVASLPLLRHLRSGGIVALQLDRVLAGMRVRTAHLFGRPFDFPEGPLRLAQLSGAPIVTVFCARRGFRDYEVELGEPLYVARAVSDNVLQEFCQKMANTMENFISRHPTQWFRFAPERSRSTRAPGSSRQETLVP